MKGTRDCWASRGRPRRHRDFRRRRNDNTSSAGLGRRRGLDYFDGVTELVENGLGRVIDVAGTGAQGVGHRLRIVGVVIGRDRRHGGSDRAAPADPHVVDERSQVRAPVVQPDEAQRVRAARGNGESSQVGGPGRGTCRGERAHHLAVDFHFQRIGTPDDGAIIGARSGLETDGVDACRGKGDGLPDGAVRLSKAAWVPIGRGEIVELAVVADDAADTDIRARGNGAASECPTRSAGSSAPVPA